MEALMDIFRDPLTRKPVIHEPIYDKTGTENF
jgi:hypothetical protein